MESQLQSEMRAHVGDYVDGKLSLHEFEDWFVPILWNIEDYGDPGATELAGRIHILIAECARGDRSIEQLRKELTRIARPFVVMRYSAAASPQEFTLSDVSNRIGPKISLGTRSDWDYWEWSYEPHRAVV